MNMEYYHKAMPTSRVGTLPDRAYYIPYKDKRTAMERLRGQSECFVPLNGRWGFGYYRDIEQVPNDGMQNSFDVSTLDMIDVPGCWETQGFEEPYYARAVLNGMMEFPTPLNYPESNNPCGLYILDFLYDPQDAGTAEMVFEGVGSCFYAWINGEFVGFSQVSHSISMFDVGGKLKKGENRLVVVNPKFNFGSYYESQRKFRMTGIFRDVYILKRAASRVNNYRVRTPLGSDYTKAEIIIDMQLLGTPEGEVHVELTDPFGAVVETKSVSAAAEVSVSFAVDAPALWSAETPSLYTAVISYGGEIIAERVGIRDARTENGVFLVNGKPVKLKGVNRQDSNPYTGDAVSRDDIVNDLVAMKRHNINAIRTSGFPATPEMIECCDELGFYVMAESEVCNGSLASCDGLEFAEITIPQNLIPSNAQSGIAPDEIDFEVSLLQLHSPFMINNADFYGHILDRIQKNVLRDINRCSVVFWSLGDGSGWGESIEKAIAWLNGFDPTRMIHYDSIYPAVYPSPRESDFSGLQLLSRKYPSTEWIRSLYGDAEFSMEQERIDPRDQKTEQLFYNLADKLPLVLCEYSHAMGNSCGDLEDYFTLMNEYDRFIGGFVWEWRDQALYAGPERCGCPKFLYSGDFNGHPMDDGYSLDGLNYPDLRPHTSLLELKNVMRPARAKYEDGSIRIRNMMDFVDLQEYVDVRFELTHDGELLKAGDIDLPSIAPHAEAVIPVPAKWPASGDIYLKIAYFAKRPSASFEKGYPLGFDEIPLDAKPSTFSLFPVVDDMADIRVQDLKQQIVLSGKTSNGDFVYTYSKAKGAFSSLMANGVELLTHPIEFNLWRAPIDNDNGLHESSAMWRAVGYDGCVTLVRGTEISEKEGNVKLMANITLQPNFWRSSMDGTAEWTISRDGVVTLRAQMMRQGGRLTPLVYAPRFGIRMFLRNEMDRVQYFAYGPTESYEDKHHGCWHGLFDAGVTELHEDYIRPQENGSHFDCSYLAVDSGSCAIRCIPAGEKKFSFNVSRYTQEELEAKRHNFELEPSAGTVVCIDYRQSGVGSNSYGPALPVKYQMVDREFLFTVSFLPESK